MSPVIVFLGLLLGPSPVAEKPDVEGARTAPPISLDQAAVEVSNVLRRLKNTPTLLPADAASKIESVVNRIDWNKEQVLKGPKKLAEPTVDRETNEPNIVWEAYALLYAAQDAKLKRPQLTDTMMCRFWPVDSMAKLEALKQAIDANRIKSGKNQGAIMRPVLWQNVTITTNEEIKSLSWPWSRDPLTAELKLGPLFFEYMASTSPPPSSKVYFDWWNDRSEASGNP